MDFSKEQQRLHDHHDFKANWKNWGPYLSERAWGTVREDECDTVNPWKHFPHDHARSRAYRWNEDGLGGISDRNQYLCFSTAFWNGKDPILKERFFGLANEEGNHGEDVKEYYFYLDNTPSHSYMKMLYKYPQEAYPYLKLIEENARRNHSEAEYELLDTGIFDQNRYFDIFIEYAKKGQEDIFIKITAFNRGNDPAYLAFIPTLWFRNTWSWGYPAGPMNDVPGKPDMSQGPKVNDSLAITAKHPAAGTYYLYAEKAQKVVFTENETNFQRLFNKPNSTPYVKDAFHRYLIDKEEKAVDPSLKGTKAAALYETTIPAQGAFSIHLRLCKEEQKLPFHECERVFQERIKESEEFWKSIQNPDLDEDQKNIQRQAVAGILWTKQLYYYDVEHWIKESEIKSHSHDQQMSGRNRVWDHLVNFDIISMPDKWEYPWYASWDLAFHCIPLGRIDPDFAKRQLILMTREWYMHPSGQLPAYEWNFSDVNPPVLAWAAWRVYKIDAANTGKADRDFLCGIFNKLLLNFTWWVNRKDEEGRNVFQGGFLGLDNISLFDRSSPLPTGGKILQSDATAWMGFYCILMMKISLELAKEQPVYQDTATKFFEHFQRIASAMVSCGGKEISLWNEEDGFFYDALHLPGGEIIPLKVRSLVGLLPLLAVETLEEKFLDKMHVFKTRMDWFVSKRPDLNANMACVHAPGTCDRRLIAILTRNRLISVLHYLLDEKEFLSDYGIRSLSKYHLDHPYQLTLGNTTYTIKYEPGASNSKLFGGNSNWRGPIWFPINFLIIESLQKFYHYYGNDLKVECPTGSGKLMNLDEIATEISVRLIRLFERDKEGKRPIYDGTQIFQKDPHWRDLILFSEYFDGDSGMGLGASHQTGWTGLIGKLLQQSGVDAQKDHKRF